MTDFGGEVVLAVGGAEMQRVRKLDHVPGVLLPVKPDLSDWVDEVWDPVCAAAVDLAEYLVAGGTPFRDAHAVVGALVRAALAGEGSLVDLVTADERLGPDAAALLAPGAPVRRRTTPGGAGPGPVAVQRVRFAARLAAQSKRIAG